MRSAVHPEPARDRHEIELKKLAQGPYLYLAEDRYGGLSTHIARDVPAGEVAMRYTLGDWYEPTYSLQDILDEGINANNDLLQIGEDAFVGRTGFFDDFVNHSCEPNCGLRLIPEGFELIALRDIRAHEELSFEYTTYWDFRDPDNLLGATLACGCGAPSCRGVIRTFKELPVHLRFRYLSAGVVAPFIAERYDAASGLPLGPSRT